MDTSHRWQFYPIVHFIMVCVHMGLSLVFITSPPERFSAAAWAPLLEMSNGQIVPWGVILGAAGILMAFGKVPTDIIGEAIAVCWCSFLSSMFIVALRDPSASATGIVVYAGLMAINAALLSQRVIDLVKIRSNRRR